MLYFYFALLYSDKIWVIDWLELQQEADCKRTAVISSSNTCGDEVKSGFGGTDLNCLKIENL